MSTLRAGNVAREAITSGYQTTREVTMTTPEQIAVTFVVGDEVYTSRARPDEIVHEVFPRALPPVLTQGRRLTFRSMTGDELFADNFVRDLADRYGEARIVTHSEPLPRSSGDWHTIGIDHLAITVADRRGARDFFRDVLKLQVMRDDPHLTVIVTGMSALFLFDAGTTAPMSDPTPSRFHHLGFVVDDLAAALTDLERFRDRFESDFAMLERDERWSLYCHYRNGDVTFMIQLSEIKAAERGLTDGASVQRLLYDYARRPYGLVFPDPPVRK